MAVRTIQRLPVLVCLWCACNLLWSCGGSWTITVRRVYTPIKWPADKGALDSYWEANRYIASHRGELIVCWPLFPTDSTYSTYSHAGVSFEAGWAPPGGWQEGDASVGNDWPGWIAAGNGFSWRGLLIARNPILPYRNFRGLAIPWWMLTVATLPFAAWTTARYVRRGTAKVVTATATTPPAYPRNPARNVYERTTPLPLDAEVHGRFLTFDYCGHGTWAILQDHESVADVEKSILSDSGILNAFTEVVLAFVDGQHRSFEVRDVSGRLLAKDGTHAVDRNELHAAEAANCRVVWTGG